MLSTVLIFTTCIIYVAPIKLLEAIEDNGSGEEPMIEIIDYDKSFVDYNKNFMFKDITKTSIMDNTYIPILLLLSMCILTIALMILLVILCRIKRKL